jgi:hypothetical protein
MCSLCGKITSKQKQQIENTLANTRLGARDTTPAIAANKKQRASSSSLLLSNCDHDSGELQQWPSGIAHDQQLLRSLRDAAWRGHAQQSCGYESSSRRTTCGSIGRSSTAHGNRQELNLLDT